MRRLLLAFATMGLVTMATGHRAVADLNVPHGDAPREIGNLPPHKPADGPGRYGPGWGHRAYGHWRHRPHPGHRPRPLCYLPPPYPYPYPYPPYYYEGYYVAPLYIPAEKLYGPQAVARFLGWDTRTRVRPIVNIVAPEGQADQEAVGPDEKAEQPANLRGTNQKALSLAWKFIGYGDAHFAEQRYADAYQRYRKAAQAAPQLAEPYFRQGYALAATGRYELAAKALKHGLELDPDWAASDFTNDELYGDNQLAKTAHLDAMAKAAEKEPHNADLMFLLGVYFHFDAEPGRAAVFFRRAAELLGGNDAHLKGFLGPAPR